MKRWLFILTISCLWVSLNGCGKTESDGYSSFFNHYSIASSIETNNGLLIRESIPVSGSETGTNTPPYQRQEVMTIQIEKENLPAFISALRADVEDSLISSGADVTGSSYGGGQPASFAAVESFSIQYIFIRKHKSHSAA